MSNFYVPRVEFWLDLGRDLGDKTTSVHMTLFDPHKGSRVLSLPISGSGPLYSSLHSLLIILLDNAKTQKV